MSATYLAVAGRIRYELQQVSQVVERTLSIWQQQGQSANDYYLDAVALNLHGVYAGLERIFEAIANGVDHVRPQARNWHQELLRQMVIEIPGTRPS
ncbi:MAG: hypothetical protein HC884_07815 [Chloroflexaceae bacterium]|nr:hypothetical protein [Chloroflexaceae bacterium]